MAYVLASGETVDSVEEFAVKRLREIAIAYKDDPVIGHHEADNILLYMLRILGHEDVVDAFIDVKKLYA